MRNVIWLLKIMISLVTTICSHRTRFISKLTHKIHSRHNVFHLGKHLFNVWKNVIHLWKSLFHLRQEKTRLWQNLFLFRQNKFHSWQERREKVCIVQYKLIFFYFFFTNGDQLWQPFFMWSLLVYNSYSFHS